MGSGFALKAQNQQLHTHFKSDLHKKSNHSVICHCHFLFANYLKLGQ